MDRDIEILAKTIYGEARGEYLHPAGGINALIAIGNVVLNRAKLSGTNIASECLKPHQFSCWNKNDPNRKVIESVSDLNKIYQKCFAVASDVICEKLPDIVNGATHYYSTHLRDPPYWAKNQQPVAKIGNHLFFKLV
jgi:spore germination cell wall hydrolase CwlJ-like protein